MDMEKGFFKVFNPETSAKRMKIPAAYTNYKNEKLPRKIFFRDRFNNMWSIRVAKIERDLYFQNGWEKFIEDNILEFGDLIIFDYDGNEVFDVKLLGITECEKKGAKGENKEEEVNVEHRKSVKSKKKNWTSNNNNSSFDVTDNYMIEEADNDEKEVKKEVEEDEEEEGEEKEIEEEVYKGKEDETEEEVEETEEEEDEEAKETIDTFKKKMSGSKDGCRKAITCKVRNLPDKYSADIFKSGHATQPKNPYFIATIRTTKKNQLYVPIDVVRDYKLELPPNMTIRDSAGREFETRVSNWNNRRIWLIGGWHSLRKWNLAEKDDRCICEFVREKCGKVLYLQVQVLHEGSISHHNNK